MAEFYRLTGVTPIKTSVYHPQTDGMVERFNGTLKRMLRKSVAKDGINSYPSCYLRIVEQNVLLQDSPHMSLSMDVRCEHIGRPMGEPGRF